MENQVNIFVEALKETTLEAIINGANAKDIFESIAKQFPCIETGRAIARLIFADIALDRGMKEETKRYLAQF